MVRPEFVDSNGCVHEGRAQRLPWGNSDVKINVGISKNQFKKCYDECIERCAEIAPWYNLSPLTRVRNAPDALTLLTSDHWQSNRTIGYSYFHHETIVSNEILIAECDESQEFGIEIGDPYVKIDKILKSGYKGDDGPMKNWPTISKSKTTAGLWGFFWKKGALAHSRYSNINTLSSGEGVHSVTVKTAILQQMADLCAMQWIVFWSWINGCWVCIRHRHCAGFDWPFECAVANLLGPTSDAPFHGITEFIKGAPVYVPFDRKILTKIFLDDMSPDKYDIDYNEWKTQEKSGVVLTTSEIMHDMQEKFNIAWNNLLTNAHSNGTLYKFNDEKFRQTQARKISHRLSIYVNNVSMYQWDYHLSTDLFHGVDTHIRYIFNWIVLYSHCVLRNTLNDTLAVVNAIGLPWLTKEVRKFLIKNRQRKWDIAFEWTSNGHYYKLICNNINFAYLELSWTAHRQLESKLLELGITIDDIKNDADLVLDFNLLIPTLKIASHYVAHKHIRRAFSKFWASKTEMHDGVNLPPSVRLLKYHLRKGFWIMLTTIPEIVCLYIICFI